MSIYYSESTKGFYLPEINGKNLPKDCVEISKIQYEELLKGQSEDKEISTDATGNPVLAGHRVDQVSVHERHWRDTELQRADIEIYKVQDSDSKARCGVGDWRAYRKSLRTWPEHPEFPKQEFRPRAPDVE